jgi:hypothetical protein
LPRVSELRVSFIWSESFSCIVPLGAPMGFLGDPGKYEQEFSKAKSGKSRWMLPWASVSGHRFWQYYLGTAELGDVSPGQAWKLLVPLYKPTQAKINPLPRPLSRVSVEGFYYPHGVAVLITVVFNENLDLNDMLKTSIPARWKEYAVIWPDGTTTQLDLLKLASHTLERLCTEAMGQGASHPLLGEPFKVVTAVDGQVDNLKEENPTNGAVHRALEAWCDWHPLFEERRPHALDEKTSFSFKEKDQSPPSHILYGLKRGRAIWFPGYFTQANSERIRKLGGYHRNLTLVSLQTESLLALMNIASGYLDRSDPLPPTLEKLARGCAGALGRLYGAAIPTYRSYSACRQIADSGLAEIIKKVRNHLGMKPPELISEMKPV